MMNCDVSLEYACLKYRYSSLGAHSGRAINDPRYARLNIDDREREDTRIAFFLSARQSHMTAFLNC